MAQFKCVWCGNHEIPEDDAQKRLNNGLGKCPKCHKFAYGNSLTLKATINTKDWKRGYGTLQGGGK